MAVDGADAYVVDYSGMHVLSVADPAHPAEVGFYSDLDAVQDVAVSGEYAYLAAGDTGLRVISIADPTHPT